MSRPRVSILMPVYNGGRFLTEAVTSLLGQTARDFELLIIDDGSTDDSAARAARFSDSRIRLLRNEQNRGLVETLNRGLAEAHGEWVARCDADDAWLPVKLEAQLTLARENPKLALIGTNASLVDEHGRSRGQFRTASRHDMLCWDLCFRNPYVHSSVLFRREVAQDLGGYHDIPAAEDYDLWSRMAARHEIAALSSPLVRYRLHASSVMAVENAAGRRRSYSHLKQIMTANLRNFASPDMAAYLEAWLEPSQDDAAQARLWGAYEDAWRDYRRRHNDPAQANVVLGEHLLNMLYRQRQLSPVSAITFLRSLSVPQLSSLPWLRAAAIFALPS